MDTDIREELRLLRARAFGPAADIDRDPAALRRLRELEALSAVGSPEKPEPVEDEPEPEPAEETPAPAAEPAESPSSTPLAEAVPPAPTDAREDAAEPDAPRPTRARFPRHIVVLWAGSVVAAAALAAGAAYGLARISPVAVSSGAPQIATLEPTSSIEVPPGWVGAGPSSKVWEFHDLVLFETTSGFSNSGGIGCFTALAAEELPERDADTSSWSLSGGLYAGCAVGTFPATISMRVDSNAPEQLRATYPDSALQFVKDGDRIGVFLDRG
ncbi:hypothetical protein [Microbacterium marinilacus]|nr:hypothetical protein [Microbacterium marinilacus]MBY0687530.1 hypothetical protein [Microbacterium marinilacus]